MMEIYFSVIIPVYNAEDYIVESIESVFGQTETDYEVIVVDDGSTDETINIVKNYGDKIRVISQSNSGVSAARNHGAKVSKGKILAFLDADDIWLPEKLIKQRSKLEEGFNMVYTNRYNIGDKGDIPDIQSDIEEMPEGDIFERLLFGNIITNSSVVIEKSSFDLLNGYNVGLLTCEDWDLWLRYSASNEIGFCPEPLVKYRFHRTGKSRNYIRQSAAREKIISSILDTDRGKKISVFGKHKVWAHTFSTSAWAAARSKDVLQAIKWYCKALLSWPFEFRIWYDLVRAIAGRI